MSHSPLAGCCKTWVFNNSIVSRIWQIKHHSPSVWFVLAIEFDHQDRFLQERPQLGCAHTKPFLKLSWLQKWSIVERLIRRKNALVSNDNRSSLRRSNTATLSGRKGCSTSSKCAHSSSILGLALGALHPDLLCDFLSSCDLLVPAHS